MLLKLMQLHIPEFIKKRKLHELFRLTADAFQSELPELHGLSFAECLLKYAQFTREQAEDCARGSGSLEEVKHRLYQNSYVFGQNLRKTLHVATWEQAVRALQAIYKIMGIDLECDGQGEIIIKQCFFSKYYSQEVCKLISALDDGIAAGLSGGGRLRFTHRITEGASHCKAYFSRGS